MSQPTSKLPDHFPEAEKIVEPSATATLLEFVEEVRRSGDTRLANMAIAVIHRAKAQSADGRGTDAQIERERELAKHAIVGALAAGHAGATHPGADHWLAAAHDAGATIKSLEAASRATHEPVVRFDSSAISTLLQCPFCGADSIRASGGEGDRKRYGTHCSALKCPGANFGLFHNSQEAADLAWNTRTCPTVPDGLSAVLTDWSFDVHDDEEGRTWLTIRNPADVVASMSVQTFGPRSGRQTISAVVLHQLSAALNAALAAAQAKGG